MRDAAGNGGDAGARNIVQAQRAHQIDESVDLAGVADDFEDENSRSCCRRRGRGRYRRCAGFRPAFRPVPTTLTKASSRSTCGPSRVRSDDPVDRHQAAKLRLDLFDDHFRAGRDDGDARQAFFDVDLGHGQAFDVVAAPGKQADDAGQTPGFVVDQHGNGMEVNCWYLGSCTYVQTGCVREGSSHAQTRTMPSSETGFSALSSGPSSISLCAAPDGIIGKQFSFGSTCMSAITGRSIRSFL